MRVAVISFHTCPYEEFGSRFSGGMNVFLREVCLRLALAGNEVTVFTRGWGEEEERVKTEGLRVVHVPCGLPKSPDLGDFLASADVFSSAVLAHLRASPPDVVFSNYWLSGRAAICARENLRVPFVHMHHTLEALKEKFSKTRYGDPHLRSARLFAEFEVQKRASYLIHPSPTDREEAMKLYPFIRDRAVVVFPGVREDILDLPRMRERGRSLLGAGEGEVVFLAGGREERTKNISGLVEVFEKFPEARARLALLGGKVEWRSEKISVLPPLSGEDYVAALDGADVVVVPSAYESFSLFGFDALARGKVLVAPSRSFLGRFVMEKGCGETFDSQEGLAVALERVLISPGRFVDGCAEAREECRSFTWESTLLSLLRVLELSLRAPLPGE
ncbi:MAG: glycosyltransferase [Deltaproteobacteria bacterium]|nr:MAG: glycosyltransferase [Deltaproteobacteria bacterium]